MKVQGPSRPEPVAPHKVGQQSSGSRADRKSSGEKVRVSRRAQVLARAREPEAPDRARIERLKAAIRSGELVIDADRIAVTMLKEEM